MRGDSSRFSLSSETTRADAGSIVLTRDPCYYYAFFFLPYLIEHHGSHHPESRQRPGLQLQGDDDEESYRQVAQRQWAEVLKNARPSSTQELSFHVRALLPTLVEALEVHIVVVVAAAVIVAAALPVTVAAAGHSPPSDAAPLLQPFHRPQATHIRCRPFAAHRPRDGPSRFAQTWHRRHRHSNQSAEHRTYRHHPLLAAVD